MDLNDKFLTVQMQCYILNHPETILTFRWPVALLLDCVAPMSTLTTTIPGAFILLRVRKKTAILNQF